MRVLLDEMFPGELARQLRERGHDVATIFEIGLAGKPDIEVMEAASRERRALVTEDAPHYVALARIYAAEGRPHHGLILTSPTRFPRTRRGLGALVRALDALLQAQPQTDALAGSTLWLQPSPPP